jgi:hypothetical protein
MLSVNYPLFNCVTKTLIKGIILRELCKKMGHGIFGGLKHIEVVISK